MMIGKGIGIIGPELGFTLPATILVCVDGQPVTTRFRSMLSGIGQWKCAMVFATQTLRQRNKRVSALNLDAQW